MYDKDDMALNCGFKFSGIVWVDYKLRGQVGKVTRGQGKQIEGTR